MKKIGAIISYSFIVLLAVVALYFLFFKENKVSIGFQPGSINYPMMFAIENGYFSEEGIDYEVQVFRSANDALDALLGNSIFIDAVIPIQNIAAIIKDNPTSLGIAAILISDTIHPLDYLVSLSSSDINEPEDLAGKTIVVFPGSYSETLTKLAFEKLGITDLEFIKRSPTDMPQALQSGEADAGIFYDPVATKSISDGWGKIIEIGFWEKHLIPEIVVGAYTYNAAMAKKKPKLKEKILKGIEKAILDSRKDPEKAKIATLPYLGSFQDILDQLPDARVELPHEIDPAIIDQTIKFYVEHNILREYVDLKTLLK